MSFRTSTERNPVRSALSTISTVGGIGSKTVVEVLIVDAVREPVQRPRMVVSGRSCYVLNPSSWHLSVSFRSTTLWSSLTFLLGEASKLSRTQQR